MAKMSQQNEPVGVGDADGRILVKEKLDRILDAIICQFLGRTQGNRGKQLQGALNDCPTVTGAVASSAVTPATVGVKRILK